MSLLAFALKEAKTMTKRITAERSGSMLWILEDLFALSTKLLNSLKGRVQVFYMEVEVHWSPMALEPAPVVCFGRRPRASRLFEQADLDVEAMQDSYARHRLRFFGEAKCRAVKRNTLQKVRYVDTEGNGDGHWFICRANVKLRGVPLMDTKRSPKA
jgi:hypothetical protein